MAKEPVVFTTKDKQVVNDALNAQEVVFTRNIARFGANSLLGQTYAQMRKDIAEVRVKFNGE